MAARTRKIRHDAETREKIKTSQLINRLQGYALGDKEHELDSTRIRAIEILLKKVMPDLSAVQQDSNVTINNVVALPETAESVDEWKASVSTRQ